MKKKLVGSALALLAGAGLAFSQEKTISLASKKPAADRSHLPDRAEKTERVFADVEESDADAEKVQESLSTNDSACGPEERFWVSGEYLFWWVKDSRTPALVTTSPAASGGVIGQPGTTVLFGGPGIDNDIRSGGRFTGGLWLNDWQTVGVEGSFFFIGSRSTNFIASSAGTPLLARPFFNVATGVEDAELVAAPNILGGAVTVNLDTRLQGFEANIVGNVSRCDECCGYTTIDVLAGYRNLGLREGLNIQENLTVSPANPVNPGTRFDLFDAFDTQNGFHGGQIGLRGEVGRGRLFANFSSKIAFGNMHEIVDINGVTTITPVGGPAQQFPGGLLAQPSNIGHYSRDVFAVVPEATVNIGFQVTSHVRAMVGYTFLYASDVVRPGDQVDRGVNPTQIPSTGNTTPSGPVRPAFTFHSTDFWAQGINFGVEFRY